MRWLEIIRQGWIQPANGKTMIKKLILALAPVLAIMSATPAAANTADDLLEIGRALGVVPYGCGYGSEIYQASCFARAAERHISQQDRQRRDRAQREANRLAEMNKAASALSKACAAGDRWSCSRAAQLGSVASDRTVAIAQSLNAACRAGDYASCRRLRQ